VFGRVVLLAVLGAMSVARASSDVARYDPRMAVRNAVVDTNGVKWIDGRYLPLEGRPFDDVEHYYDRLPRGVSTNVNAGVRSMKHHTAGMQFRFSTDSRQIVFRWKPYGGVRPGDNLTQIAKSGFDVYRRPRGGAWRYLETGRIDSESGATCAVRWNPGEECLVNLPLYNGIREFAVGIDREASVAALPPRASGVTRPVVFYGTSITQGASASRPGLSFVNMVGRDLDVPVVNLGFSGSGMMEFEMSEHLARIDASCYVLDCLWNMHRGLIAENYERFARNLRRLRPDVPIVFAAPCDVHGNGGVHRMDLREQAAKAIFDRFVAEGWKDIRWLPRVGQLSGDGEGTVDGCHPNDLGMRAIAEVYDRCLGDLLHLDSAGLARQPRTPSVTEPETARTSHGDAADIVIENARFRLVVGADARVRSLVLKSTGEECAEGSEGLPLFSVTQDRPFNNEVKLIRPNKRTTYPANALRRAGDRLVVGFRIAPYEAAVDLKITDAYVAFELADFLVDKEDYGSLKMDVPPVASFRVLQLPIRNRKNFGDWLNASWDGKSAVGVVGTSPYADIDHEERRGFRILFADLVRGQKLKGASAAMIAANGREDFLDCMDRLEHDYGLPLGVESRRSDAVKAFIYHVGGEASPRNIDKHIEWARRGGFKYMTFDACNFTKEIDSWCLNGDFDWNEHFPNGADDLRRFLAKVKAAGIRPGLHFLHTHIGMKSRYVTPVADPRLNKTRRFTLARPLAATTNETEITVFEPTEGTTLFPACRVLQFGGELVSYESYTREPPYRFLGVRRGVWNTRVTAHERGEIGGILDISEFGRPMSCYLDQQTDLQEEVAAKIAAIYNCGFEYAYFDGSEGVNVPFNFHVSNAQYRQWKLLEPKPLFSEGAAKTHFDWHILTGANAFDCFAAEDFKRCLVKYPVAQAPLSWQDMTRVNFGWWMFWAKGRPDWWKKVSDGTRPDHWQFACSQCLAWDCAATVVVKLDRVEADRENAIACFEVMRLWEEARSRNLLSPAQKEMLKDTSREYHLSIVDGRAELRLVGEDE